jgi:hypothetical protein
VALQKKLIKLHTYVVTAVVFKQRLNVALLFHSSEKTGGMTNLSVIIFVRIFNFNPFTVDLMDILHNTACRTVTGQHTVRKGTDNSVSSIKPLELTIDAAQHQFLSTYCNNVQHPLASLHASINCNNTALSKWIKLIPHVLYRTHY